LLPLRPHFARHAFSPFRAIGHYFITLRYCHFIHFAIFAAAAISPAFDEADLLTLPMRLYHFADLLPFTLRQLSADAATPAPPFTIARD